MGYSPWGLKESNMTKRLTFSLFTSVSLYFVAQSGVSRCKHCSKGSQVPAPESLPFFHLGLIPNKISHQEPQKPGQTQSLLWLLLLKPPWTSLEGLPPTQVPLL